MKKRTRKTYEVRARGVSRAEPDIDAIVAALLHHVRTSDPSKDHPADDVATPETPDGFESPHSH